MNSHDIERRLKQLERQLRALADAVGALTAALYKFTHRPRAGALGVTFTSSGDSMNAQLIATLPTTREDNSALAPTDIASITFQKTSLTGSPPAAGPQTTLVVNTASPGVGLTPDQITFTDSTSATGDAYTFFVTDTAGNVGALSNVVTNPGTVVTPPTLSPPAAGTLAATFS